MGSGFSLSEKGQATERFPLWLQQCALSFGSVPELSLQASLHAGTGARVPATEAETGPSLESSSRPTRNLREKGRKGERKREQKKGEGKEKGREERGERRERGTVVNSFDRVLTSEASSSSHFTLFFFFFPLYSLMYRREKSLLSS